MNLFPNFLSDDCKKIFLSISDNDFLNEFTLVGGSAVSYYLEHRLSEDLDFFSWEKELNNLTLNKFLRDVSSKHDLNILNRNLIQIDLQIDNTKLTFFTNDWMELKNQRNYLHQKIFIASLELLTAMKLNTLSLRAKFRDYYDLFVISKEVYTINEMFEIAMKYLPGMTKKIFAMQLCYTSDLADESIKHLSPKYKVRVEEIKNHFESKIEEFIG